MSTPPLGEFLGGLRDHGFVVGVDDHLRVARLVAHEADWSLPTLRHALRSILAKDLASRAAFDHYFDAFFRSAQAQYSSSSNLRPASEPASPALASLPRPRRDRSRRPWTRPMIAVGIAMGLLAAALPLILNRPEPLVVEETGSASESVVATASEAPADRLAGAVPLLLAGLFLMAFAPLLSFVAAPPRHRRTVKGPWSYRPRRAWSQVRPWFDGQSIEDAAGDLSLRSGFGQGPRLDAKKTVHLTAQSGGYPVLVFSNAPASPVYVVLLDRSPAAAPWRPVADALFESIRASGVTLVTYEFDGNPELCHPLRRSGPAVPLGTLAGRHDGLIIVGDGAEGCDPLTGKPASWLGLLNAFHPRLWLNPLPPSRWSAGALAIAASMPVGPLRASTVAWIAFPDRTSFHRGRPMPRVIETGVSSLVGLQALRDYLGGAFAWLQACAVAGEPDHGTALWLADRLGIRVSDEDRLRILTLPWFVSRQWPPKLRSLLVAELRNEDPPLEEQVRIVLLESFETDAPVPNSLAHLRWQLQKAEHEVLLGRREGAHALLGLARSDVRTEAQQLIEEVVGGSTGEGRDVLQRAAARRRSVSRLQAGSLILGGGLVAAGLVIAAWPQGEPGGQAVVTVSGPAPPMTVPSSRGTDMPASSPIGAPLRGALHVESQPSGATVTVDGQPRGVTSVDVADLALGAHEVRVELKGYVGVAQTVDLTPEAPRSELKFTLSRSAPMIGTAAITSSPSGAMVRINGAPVGQTPFVDSRLRMGIYRIELVKEGFEIWSRSIIVQPGEPARIYVQLRPLVRASEAPATSDAVDANRIYRNSPDEVDVVARKQSGPSASYPLSAPRLRSGEWVSVRVSFVVTEDGEVIDPKLIESTAAYVVEEAVLSAVRNWRYSPAVKNGMKVKVRVEFRQTFRAG